MASKSKKEKSSPFVFVDIAAKKKPSKAEVPVSFTQGGRVAFAPGVSVESLKEVILGMNARMLEMAELIGALQGNKPPSIIINPSKNGR